MLLVAIRRGIAESPFVGEGHKKLRARLAARGSPPGAGPGKAARTPKACHNRRAAAPPIDFASELSRRRAGRPGVVYPRRAVKVLYLLRHAKSSWDDPALSDHKRPLAPRGRRAAARIAAHLDREGIRPALILCSSSRRTRQTLELVAAALPDVPAKVEADLYGAGEASLLRRAHRLPDSADSVMLVGHNPGLQDLALALAGGGDAQALARLRAKMPTAALATLAAPLTRWRDLRQGGAELVAFVVPRELG